MSKAYLFVIFVAAGCSSGPTDPTPDMSMQLVEPHNFAQITAAVWPPTVSSCVFASCHSRAGASQAGKLDLETDPYTALVNAPASNKQAVTEGKVRVKPCDPDNSLLWIKLNLPLSATSADQGYGEYMPQSAGAHIPQAYLDGIHDWIARGAHKDEPADVTGTTCTLDNPDGGH
jgi:hypothetical protein